MSQPQIIIGGHEGHHNLEGTARPYRDLSTVCIVPTRGVIPARVVERYMALMSPMNQPFTRMFVAGMEVGAAYNSAIQNILEHPDLSKWKFVLTLEEDNLPPPDGLLQLVERLDDGPVQKGGLVAVGGLYFTKGPGGQPMCYGRPNGVVSFEPFLPDHEGLHPCNGLGMGFTLFKLDLFRKLDPPWFVTEQRYDPHSGVKAMTQDLYFFQRVREAGYRVACDASVKVGHLDPQTGVVW